MQYIGQSPVFGEFPSQVITGTGSTDYTTNFTMASERGILVFVNGAVQRPLVDYTAGGTSLKFTSAVATGDQIIVQGLGLPKSELSISSVVASELRDNVFCVYGGTANVITLTFANQFGKPLNYEPGAQFRFRATASNTGATTINVEGLGAKPCVTVTGVALPAGYIRTGVDTTITFDTTGNRFVVSREVERGSNANGSWSRRDDGSQICTFRFLGAISNVAVPPTGIYRGDVIWPFPISFSGIPSMSGVGVDNSTFGWVSGGSPASSAIGSFVYFTSNSNVLSSSILLTANGYWY